MVGGQVGACRCGQLRAALGRMRAYNFETAPGHFLTLIQRAKLQTCHAINRIHEGSIERQIFAVTLCKVHLLM